VTLILGIETSTQVSSVAFAGDDGVLASMSLARGRGHAEFLVPAILACAERGGFSLRDVTGVASGLGPGLFTGMRVGVATAKTIAQALGVPIAGVASLDLLAHAARATSQLVCAVLDAKRNEVFAAFYRDGKRIDDITTYEPAALAADIAARDEDVYVVGTGAKTHAERYPSAISLVELAAERLARGDADDAATLEPLYVRKSDAEIKWERHGVVIERPDRVKIAKGATA
jgi:tRNA threonylcarbamoyladenosine biosynthesis protein TsaB